MYLGNLGETMKKIILLLSLVSFLHASSVDELKQHVRDTLPQLEGWCSEEKAEKLIDLVLETKPEICVEIGVFGGRSLFPVAAALKHLGNGLIIGIDPWSEEECLKHFDPIKDAPHIQWWSKINIDLIYRSYLSMLSAEQLANHVITLKVTAERAATLLAPIDILHIDTNHGEISSTKNIELFLPKVRSGGYIWINDSLAYSMQPTIDYLLERCEFIEVIDNGNCILCRKK